MLKRLWVLFALATPAYAVSDYPSDTYYAAALNVAVSATATDVFCIENKARVTRVYVITAFAQAASSGTVLAVVVKRSIPDTGGTEVTGNSVPIAIGDSSAQPAKATLRAYTTSPTTLGTAIGIVVGTRWGLTTQGSASNNVGGYRIDFAVGGGDFAPVVLRGTEALCLTYGGTNLALTSDIDIRWTEADQ
jgi:hypothetical protein